MRELHPALRAEHQLLQAVRRRLVRADRDRLGRGQPHLRGAPGRPRRRRRGWRTGCPAATSTRTSRSPRCSPAACTASSSELELEPALDRQRLHLRTRRGCPRTLREARDAFDGSAIARDGLRRRGRRPLHEHGRRRARRVRRRGHRLGAAPRLRADVSMTSDRVHRHQPGDRQSRSTDVAAGRRVERDRRGDRARRTRRSRPGATWRRATGPGCCAASPRSSTPTSRSWPSSRCATPATRSATRAGRPATSATCLNYYSAAPERLFGRQIPVAGGVDVTFHEPLGVVGVIVPWNFPMPIAGWGFAPALAAGNTVVLKPAELTPLTAIRLGELALEAGLPEGVFTVIPGKGSVVGERFVTHPLVRKVVLHRLDRGRQADHGRLRRPGEAGDPRARRQERQHRLRRRRPREGRGHRAVRRLRQRRPGLLRPLPDPGRSASAYDEFLELLEPAVHGRPGARPGRPGQPRWAR